MKQSGPAANSASRLKLQQSYPKPAGAAASPWPGTATGHCSANQAKTSTLHGCSHFRPRICKECLAHSSRPPPRRRRVGESSKRPVRSSGFQVAPFAWAMTARVLGALAAFRECDQSNQQNRGLTAKEVCRSGAGCRRGTDVGAPSAHPAQPGLRGRRSLSFANRRSTDARRRPNDLTESSSS